MPVPVISPGNAPLVEIFSSIQGEGVLAGCRQVFIRFSDCNLDCDYCDTDFQRAESCRVENTVGSGQFSHIRNPVDLQQVDQTLQEWQAASPGLHHSVSLTGGEPLLHADVLQKWLPSLSSILPVFLETNGTLPHALEPLMPWVEWISMDIKTVSTSGHATPWEQHSDFLDVAGAALCQIKAVVDESTTEAEVNEIARFLRTASVSAPLILQPLTRHNSVSVAPEHLLKLQEAACQDYADVRVIPQMHVFLNLL
jgi:organic radical activating enzyme